MMKERRYPLVDTIKTLQKQVLQEINTIQSPSRRPYAEVIIKGIKIPFMTLVPMSVVLKKKFLNN